MKELSGGYCGWDPSCGSSTLYKICAVQAEVQAEDVQYRVRETLCSASLSLYCTPSACTSDMPQSVLDTIACTAKTLYRVN